MRLVHKLRKYSRLLRRATSAVVSIRCSLTLVRGRLKGTDRQITVAYAGRRYNAAYLLQTLFEESQILQSSRGTVLTVGRTLRRLGREADLTIVDLGWPYDQWFNRHGGYLAVPAWIRMRIELTGGWEQVYANFHKSVRSEQMRLVRRSGYRYSLTRDLQAIEDFYHRMYVPFIRTRHRADSYIEPQRNIVKRATQGYLLQLLSGDDVVAGAVIYPEAKTLHFLWLGIAADPSGAFPKAAISALSFFAIQYACENGYRAVDRAGTRPFPGEGAYRSKRRWGAAVSDSFSYNSLLLRPRKGSDAALDFCARFPLLARSRRGLELVGVFHNGEAGEDALDQLRREFGCPGIYRVTAICVGDENGSATMSYAGDPCQYRVLRTRTDDFADTYVQLTRAAATEAGGPHSLHTAAAALQTQDGPSR